MWETPQGISRAPKIGARKLRRSEAEKPPHPRPFSPAGEKGGLRTALAAVGFDGFVVFFQSIWGKNALAAFAFCFHSPNQKLLVL